MVQQVIINDKQPSYFPDIMLSFLLKRTPNLNPNFLQIWRLTLLAP